ncbi:isochorismate synthase [Pseudoduganella chitinolytica]|uniref:isochorismate synthase n=1 Tax=Pseudoduganella chitinolytica TaxID=34070 RepID=A0ABY8BGD9_9BURK|nr:isochorismate synthase [Pseudoduganella chitinolytica]WEF34970.1 isochorismate synthase [Pseudoduganella chitinolytica]
MATSLFLSPHRSVRADGVFERIATPAAGDLQAALAQALARARDAGIDNPIAIGAIPFDTTRPSELIVPERAEIFRREELPPLAARPLAPIVASTSIPGEERFKQGVRQAVANFAHSDIRKAVLSRVLEVELAGRADPAALFASLAAQNPTGFQFRIPLADGAELVGVSPELLLRKEGARIVSNPLAGSARRQPDADSDAAAGGALLQSPKDLREHGYVTHDIRRLLAPLCATLDVPEQPSLLSTNAMWHLSTRIEGTLRDPALTSLQLACHLHPTPAVCGYPTDLARKLIDLVEPFDRGLFAGVVGWCDADGNGEWAVTIRCGTVQGNIIRLFAGAGIVADSCPEAELAETQGKLGTMLRALGAVRPAASANVDLAAEAA